MSTLAIVAALLGPAPAAAYGDLCGSVPAACAYAGPDAPALDADVCWDGSAVALKTGSWCPSGATAYHAAFGEVDPTGLVTAYIPLPDACEAGYCVAPSSGPTQAGELCCGSGGCKLDVLDCEDEVVWCGVIWVNVHGEIYCLEPDE